VPDPQEGQPEALSAAQTAFGAGIRLSILGVSTDVAADHLQRMANAGAGKPLDLVWGRDSDAARPYQASDDPAELALQLQGILGDVRSCTVVLNGRVDDADRGQGSVVLDGNALQPGIDYRLLDERTLELAGAACEQVLSLASELSIVFPCPTR
jgi:hypothetical protein